MRQGNSSSYAPRSAIPSLLRDYCAAAKRDSIDF
jgi:hypothetical protein